MPHYDCLLKRRASSNFRRAESCIHWKGWWETAPDIQWKMKGCEVPSMIIPLGSGAGAFLSCLGLQRGKGNTEAVPGQGARGGDPAAVSQENMNTLWVAFGWDQAPILLWLDAQDNFVGHSNSPSWVLDSSASAERGIWKCHSKNVGFFKPSELICSTCQDILYVSHFLFFFFFFCKAICTEFSAPCWKCQQIRLFHFCWQKVWSNFFPLLAED